MTLLDVSHLTVRTGEDERVVSDVSFSLDAGERLGLIGESGSGKSVTSLAVTGLLDGGLTASGSVLLDGVQTVGTPDRMLSSVRGAVASIVFQEPLTALDPLMRVGKQIAEPMVRHLRLRKRELREAVESALAEVLLPDPRIARAYPHERAVWRHTREQPRQPFAALDLGGFAQIFCVDTQQIEGKKYERFALLQRLLQR